MSRSSLAHHRTRTKLPSSHGLASRHPLPSLAHQSSYQYTTLRHSTAAQQRPPNLSKPSRRSPPRPLPSPHRPPLPASSARRRAIAAWPAASAPHSPPRQRAETTRPRSPRRVPAGVGVGAAQVPCSRAGSAAVSADSRWA